MIIIFAAGVASAIMLLAGIGVLIYTLMRKSHLQQQSRQRSYAVTDFRTLPAGRANWPSHEISVDHTDMARDLSGQLSTKIIVLEQLLTESQKQIDRMEQLLAEVKAASKDS